MRLCMEFKLKKSQLPIQYRVCIVSFIKKALTEANDGKYYNEYYQDTKQKPFSFSVMLRQPAFENGSIKFEGDTIKVYFSITDKNRAGLIMCNCFLKMKKVNFPLPDDNAMQLITLSRMNEKVIEDNRVIFKTVGGSPICVREHDRMTNKDRYYNCMDKNYVQKLQELIRTQCKSLGYSEQQSEQIKVNGVEGKKVVVKHYDTYIDAFAGIIDISAPTEILQEFYTVGMGSKKSTGFGFVDVLN